MTSTATVIDVRGVAKSFPEDYRLTAWMKRLGKPRPRRVVLRDIDLSVQRGEIFGLLGPNGAGKTTLLKMLVTLLLPDRGSIRIAGINAIASPLEVKRRIGLSISDERSFYYRLTARANLEFFGILADVGPNDLPRRTAHVLEIVDLSSAADLPVRNFSSGMRQRLAIARALLGDPEVLIFDEPTRTVDPVHAMELRALIRSRLADTLGKTVLMSTNLLDEAWSVCDRVGILNAGRLVAVGAPEALAAKYAERRSYAISFERLDEDLPRRLRLLTGVEDVALKDTPRGKVVTVAVDLQGRNFTEMLKAISSNGSIVSSLRDLDDALFGVFRNTMVSDG